MKKVLVIGDGCKDVFQYGKCKRLSPEAPVPIFLPTFKKENGGMAVNVYNNLIALGVECDILTNSGITKTRLVDEVSNQMLLRVDENDFIFMTPSRYEQLLNYDYSKYDAVTISDYNKGFISEELIRHISVSNPNTFIDTKKKFGSWATRLRCIKINKKEFDENVTDEFLSEYAGDLIVTTGKKGAFLLSEDDGIMKKEEFPIVDSHDVRDLTGAGDTFLAGIVASFIKNNDIRKAIQFANRCAAWAVTQKGIAVVDKSKI